MKLTPAQLQRFEAFLDRVKGETYPEPIRELHQMVTADMMKHLWDKYPPRPGARVLDVGCGQGVALQHFRDRGLSATGITINSQDLKECAAKGFDVREMDQSFLDFEDASIDLVWCRHCIEHSIFPYFTMSEFSRVLKPGGMLFLEVPAPDTACHHERNLNHYSVLGKSMWGQLCARTGFDVLESLDIRFTVEAGPDIYWAIFCRRK
jgi:ubiquinone/menaquinone biosynthesis C-methylase UbiE